MHPVAFRDPFQRTLQPLHTVAVIPARYHSTRLPGKALADIAGRPMIEHVYRRAAEASGIEAVVVATDDDRIRAAVEHFGGVVRMTGSHHRTGTDRVAEVARDLECDIVVGVQGDEPLIAPEMISEAVAPFDRDAQVMMTTLRRAIRDEAEYHNPNVVKVVVDLRGDALYFSRSPIPFVREAAPGPPKGGPHEEVGSREKAYVEAGFRRAAYVHVGLYAYRRDFLLTLATLPQTPLEVAESLEQLRVLQHGYRIRTVETSHESVGVDTPEDLERVRAQLSVAARG